MKFSDQKPPNWNKLEELFGADWKDAVVTYGDTVYSSRPISPDLEAHEAVHIRQQAGDYGLNAEHWWRRYYTDPAFRLEQEIEAYQAQYDYMKKHCNNRNLLFKMRDKLARDLSGTVYGKCCDYVSAFCVIAQKPKKLVNV